MLFPAKCVKYLPMNARHSETVHMTLCDSADKYDFIKKTKGTNDDVTIGFSREWNIYCLLFTCMSIIVEFISQCARRVSGKDDNGA
jgi:hypothetical protein